MADALYQAFRALLHAADGNARSRALRLAIGALVSEPTLLISPRQLPPRGNGASAIERQNFATSRAPPVADWEGTRRRLYSIYRVASREERIAFAGQLGISAST
jgi:hypothetical protein